MRILCAAAPDATLIETVFISVNPCSSVAKLYFQDNPVLELLGVLHVWHLW
jgi:hypothetical protein